MKDINKGYDEAETVKPYARRGNPLAIAAGSHETGRAEGLGAMLGRQPEIPGSETVTSIASVPANYAPSIAALPFIPAAMGGSIAGKIEGRRKIKDLVAQEMGYAPAGFGVSNRMAPNRALAAAN